MSLHTKRNHRTRARVLGAVAGAALLIGGAFATQAFADSGVTPAPAAPKVTTSSAPVAAPAPAPAPAAPKADSAPKAVEAGKSADAGKPASAGEAVPAPAPAGNAPKVIKPGSGVQK
ncbi:hypothetical protein [Streptomyces sp. NPDC048442]|uniref:hypothetical protein n=1 Tax=Streptomyces sp. NPDC048442 TaxID=3154823 RepID=UPI0034279E4A